MTWRRTRKLSRFGVGLSIALPTRRSPRAAARERRLRSSVGGGIRKRHVIVKRLRDDVFCRCGSSGDCAVGHALLPAFGQRVSEVSRRVTAERVRVCLATRLVEYSIPC